MNTLLVRNIFIWIIFVCQVKCSVIAYMMKNCWCPFFIICISCQTIASGKNRDIPRKRFMFLVIKKHIKKFQSVVFGNIFQGCCYIPEKFCHGIFVEIMKQFKSVEHISEILHHKFNKIIMLFAYDFLIDLRKKSICLIKLYDRSNHVTVFCANIIKRFENKSIAYIRMQIVFSQIKFDDCFFKILFCTFHDSPIFLRSVPLDLRMSHVYALLRCILIQEHLK